jgi:hypothetical protein
MGPASRTPSAEPPVTRADDDDAVPGDGGDLRGSGHLDMCADRLRGLVDDGDEVATVVEFQGAGNWKRVNRLSTMSWR